MRLPVGAQFCQRSLRQWHVTIFVTFAALDVDHHAAAVDVRDFQGTAFEQAQAAGVDRQQANTVAFEADAAQNAANFIAGENDRQALLAMRSDEFESGPLAAQGFLKEELDAAYRDGAGGALPFFDVLHVEEVVAQLFFGDLIRGIVVMLGELADRAQIQLLRAFGVAVKLHILQHAGSEFGHDIPPLK